MGPSLAATIRDDGVHGASLLAQPAIDALGHVDVVARRAATAVVAGFRLDRDRLGGADRLAQLARDAPLLAIGIATQRVLTPEARRDRVLLVRIVDRRLRLEEVAKGQRMALHELPQRKSLDVLSDAHAGTPTRAYISTPDTKNTQNNDTGRNTFQPSRISWSYR